jgi:hypothetical protein
MLEGQGQHLDAGNSEHLVRLGRMQAEAGLRGALVWVHCVVEDVVERGAQPIESFRWTIERQRLALTHREHTQVVDAVDVVCMFVGVNDGIDPGEASSNELQSQLRRRVDENGRTAGFQHRSRARAFVAGIGRATDGTVTPDLGHAE